MEFFFGFNEEGAVVNFDDLADDGAGIFGVLKASIWSLRPLTK